MKNFISVPSYFVHQIISQTLLTEELFEPLLCEAKKKIYTYNYDKEELFIATWKILLSEAL